MKLGEEIVVGNLTLVYVDEFYEIKQYPGWTISRTDDDHVLVLTCPNAIHRYWRNSLDACVRELKVWMRWRIEAIESERRSNGKTHTSL